MVQKSDNTAKNLLQIYYDELKIRPTIEETHRLLGLNDDSNIISIDQYAGIYRILYNAEYLDGEMSDKALEILSQTDYNNGLTKYLPSEIKVSHKYGVRQYRDDKTYQLHDCGIIYSTNPYILCVMTNGKNLEKQENIVAEISKTAYNIFK